MKKLFALVLWACFIVPTISYAQGPTEICFTSDGKNCVPAIQASNSVAISLAASSTVELVPLTANKAIFITSWDVMSAGTGTFTLVYGTGTACATNQVALTGAYPLIAQAGISKGNGTGPILFVPRSNALCTIASTSVQMSGSLSYVKF